VSDDRRTVLEWFRGGWWRWYLDKDDKPIMFVKDDGFLRDLNDEHYLNRLLEKR